MNQIIHKEYSKIASYIETLPHRFEQGEGEVLHSGRNEVRCFRYQDMTFVVKRFKNVNFVQQWAYTFFCKTKAERAYLYAAELRERGIDTPHEVAYFEQKRCGLFLTGYFVCLHCACPTAFSMLEKEDEFNQTLAADLSAFIAVMHQKGILFGDLNLGNFLYKQGADGHYSFVMVDTNRSRFCKGVPSLHQRLKNLRTLTHRRDLFRFMMEAYARVFGETSSTFVVDAFRMLESFEKKRKIQHKLKDFFKNRKK